MMRRLAACAVLSLIFAASALAQQPFSATWSHSPPDPPLASTCQGGPGVPDGRLVKVFHDANENGPDGSDSLATICAVPPNCASGPYGTVNYNQFTMNGAEGGDGAGYFYTDQNFTSSLGMPPVPRYYLRIYEADGTTVLWTSTVKTLVSGPQIVNIPSNEWTCGAGGPQCVVRDEHE